MQKLTMNVPIPHVCHIHLRRLRQKVGHFQLLALLPRGLAMATCHRKATHTDQRLTASNITVIRAVHNSNRRTAPTPTGFTKRGCTITLLIGARIDQDRVCGQQFCLSNTMSQALETWVLPHSVQLQEACGAVKGFQIWGLPIQITS